MNVGKNALPAAVLPLSVIGLGPPPGAGTNPKRSNYSLTVCAWFLSPLREARTFEGRARSSGPTLSFSERTDA
jgi:hypothetical protein